MAKMRYYTQEKNSIRNKVKKKENSEIHFLKKKSAKRRDLKLQILSNSNMKLCTTLLV